MNYEELKNLKHPDCDNQHINCHTRLHKNSNINYVYGLFVFNSHCILEYNDFEMLYYESYEINKVPYRKNSFGNYFYLKAIKPKKITYLMHTKQQMTDLISKLIKNIEYFEKQRKIKEKLYELNKDFSNDD